MLCLSCGNTQSMKQFAMSSTSEKDRINGMHLQSTQGTQKRNVGDIFRHIMQAFQESIRRTYTVAAQA